MPGRAWSAKLCGRQSSSPARAARQPRAMDELERQRAVELSCPRAAGSGSPPVPERRTPDGGSTCVVVDFRSSIAPPPSRRCPSPTGRLPRSRMRQAIGKETRRPSPRVDQEPDEPDDLPHDHPEAADLQRGRSIRRQEPCCMGPTPARPGNVIPVRPGDPRSLRPAARSTDLRLQNRIATARKSAESFTFSDVEASGASRTAPVR